MGDDGWRGRSRDWLVAFGIAVLVLLGAATAQPGRIPLDAAGCLLLVLSATALAVRRRTPRLVLGITTVCLLVYQARGYPGVVPALPTMFALYATVQAGHRRLAGAAIAAILVGGFSAEVALSSGGRAAPDAFQRWFLLIGWMVAASVAAEVARQRQAYLEQVEQRAADAERTREETARRRADEERLRIARELHDSLTHSISIIKVQAGVAVHLARKRDEPVPEALLAIQQASGEATRELRATLEVLRSDGDQPGSGLDRLENLVDGARKAGLPVVVNVSGDQRPLPAPVDRAAYRIIQEALTNVTRHAGAATVAVELDYRDGALTVRVDDDGRGAPGDGGRSQDDGGRVQDGRTRQRRWRESRTGGGAGRDAGTGGRPRRLSARRSAGRWRLRGPGRTADRGGLVIRVLLADDQALIRAGFRALLNAEDDIEVVAEAANGVQAVALAVTHLPDVALIDIQMPVLDGIQATRQIAADPRLAGVHVVMLTNYGLDEYVYSALRAGAGGFLVKDTEPEDLLHGVRVAARGDALLSPTITRRLVDEYVSRPPQHDLSKTLAVLTNREREVVTLAAGGLSNDEIAAQMVISLATAKTHISRAMTKLHARDRAQLVVLAYESGLVTPANPRWAP